MSKISDIAYARYQFDWMISHGYIVDSLSDVADEQKYECFNGLCKLDYQTPTFSDYLFEHGFGGETWACYDEFLQAEYLDVDYMHTILNEDEYKEYCVDTGRVRTATSPHCIHKKQNG